MLNIPEVLDHILYFTTNNIIDLLLINKYFSKNVKKIRITSNKNLPGLGDKHLEVLINLTELNLTTGSVAGSKNTFFKPKENKITNNGLIKLKNLISLDLSDNEFITNEVVSKLSNLTKLHLFLNHNIKNEGISSLHKLKFLNLDRNIEIDDKGISMLTNLETLILHHNEQITDDCISRLTNLTYLDLSIDHPHNPGSNNPISDEGIRHLFKLQTLNLKYNTMITNNGISMLTSLTELNIINNKLITEEGIKHLTNLTSLEY